MRNRWLCWPATRAFKAKKPVVTDFHDFRTANSVKNAPVSGIRVNKSAGAGCPGVPVSVKRRACQPVVVCGVATTKQRLASMVTAGLPVEVPWTRSLVLARFHRRAFWRNRCISTQGGVALARR